MRIVGGEFGGRRLLTPRSDAIRPSSDRLRQTLFDILAHGYGDAVDNARVLDTFAGTGAIGLEALSRGARHALFVEEDAAARGLIRGNVESLGLTGKTRIFRRDATRLGEAGTIPPFDLMFADPPYGHGLGEKALAAALAGGWLRSRRARRARGTGGRDRPAHRGIRDAGAPGCGRLPAHLLQDTVRRIAARPAMQAVRSIG